MKKVLAGAAVSVAGLAALRRFGPELHQHLTAKCQEAMAKCHEMFAQQQQSPCPPVDKAA